ncbi:DUF2637 domain-containing protein [Streptomyces aureus]
MSLPPMPVKPKRSRQPLAETAPDVILGVLGVAGLVLSGWSLGTLMHDTAGAPWLVSMFAVAVFDLVALAAGILVYARRADPWSAAGARAVMTVALAASSAVNGAHGYALGGWTTAAVLAAAPLAFEVVFELRHRTLTVLVWWLFRREAFNRLRLDAWERIAVNVDGTQITSVRGTPESLARTIQELKSQTAPELKPAPSGSIKDAVRVQYDSGITDPDAIVRAVQAERPTASVETIKRLARAVRTEGGYA